MTTKTTTTMKAQKFTIGQTINNIKNEILACENMIEMPVIVKCNCIVATADTTYAVSVKDNKATVEIGLYSTPCYFTERKANEVAEKFHAENGYGKLIWKVFGWKDFYKARREALQARLDAFMSIPNIEEKMNIEF